MKDFFFDFDGNETTKVLVEFLRKPHYQTRGKETERRKKESGRMSPQKKIWFVFAVTPTDDWCLVDLLVKDCFTTNKNTLLKDACIDQHDK